MRHEDQRLLLRVAPARRLRHQPLDARDRRRPSPAPARAARVSSGPSTAASAAPDASARRTRSIFSRSRDGVGGGALRTRASRRPSLQLPPSRRRRASIGMPTRGGKPPMSARRVELVHGGSGVPCGEARLDAHVLRKVLRPQQLQQPEEPVRVVFERRRAQQQHVAAERRDRRNRAPGRIAGMARRTPQTLRLVDDQQIDAGAHRLLGQLRAARSASRARSPRGDAARTD